MKYSRRTFIRLQGMAAGGLLLNHSLQSNVSLAVSELRKEDSSFKLAFCGSEDEFTRYRDLLGNRFTGEFKRVEPSGIRRMHPVAVWIDAGVRNRVKLAAEWMQAGMHILMEPPMAVNVVEFDQLQESANISNVGLGITLFLRFLTSSEKAADLLARGTIGQIRSCRIQLNDPNRDSLMKGRGNTFLAEGICLVDLARFILGTTLTSLLASRVAEAKASIPAKNLNLMLYFTDIPLTFSNSKDHFDNVAIWSVLVIGEKGQLRLSAGNRLDLLENGKWRSVEIGKGEDDGNAVRMLVNDFRLSCMQGKEPEVNALDGLALCQMEDASLRSALSGQTINISQTQHDTR